MHSLCILVDIGWEYQLLFRAIVSMLGAVISFEPFFGRQLFLAEMGVKMIDLSLLRRVDEITLDDGRRKVLLMLDGFVVGRGIVG